MSSNTDGFLSRQFRRHSQNIGERFIERADTVHALAEQLRHDKLTRGAGDVVLDLADKAERFGRYLVGTNLDTFLHDAEDFGRKKPLVVALSGLIVGVGASRIYKAGAQNRSQGNNS
jgi:hypothetical protein